MTILLPDISAVIFPQKEGFQKDNMGSFYIKRMPSFRLSKLERGGKLGFEGRVHVSMGASGPTVFESEGASSHGFCNF